MNILPASERSLPVNVVCQPQRFFVWKERLFHLIHDVGERNPVSGTAKAWLPPAPGCPKAFSDGPNILRAAFRGSFMKPAENAVGI